MTNGDSLISDRQMAFVYEYVKDYNGTQAVIRAGYSKNGAGVTATRFLKDPNIVAEIEKLKAEKAQEHGITQDFILAKLKHISVNELENTGNRIKCLELMGKFLGMWDGTSRPDDSRDISTHRAAVLQSVRKLGKAA